MLAGSTANSVSSVRVSACESVRVQSEKYRPCGTPVTPSVSNGPTASLPGVIGPVNAVAVRAWVTML